MILLIPLKARNPFLPHLIPLCSRKYGTVIELKIYKNGLASMKIMFVMKLSPFFPHLHGTARAKGRQFQN